MPAQPSSSGEISTEITEVLEDLAHEGRNAVQGMEAGLALLRWKEDLSVVDELRAVRDRIVLLLRDFELILSPPTVSPRACNLTELWSAAWEGVTDSGRGGEVELIEEGEAPNPGPAADPAALESVFRAILDVCLLVPSRPLRIELSCGVRGEGEGAETLQWRIKAYAPGCPARKGETLKRRLRARHRLDLFFAHRILAAHGGHLSARLGAAELEFRLELSMPDSRSPRCAE